MNKFLGVLLILIIVTVLSFTSYSLIDNTIVNFIINNSIVFVGATVISKFIKNENYKEKLVRTLSVKFFNFTF